MAANRSSSTFHVQRYDAMLVPPADNTPHEFKHLSDIDDQKGLRKYMPIIQFYRHHPSMEGQDIAGVIRYALAAVLVPYYPIAGRLRELADGSSRLVVKCTGEGALFVVADADVCIEQLGDLMSPPFPFLDKFLVDVPNSRDMINSPILLVQVTRLQCGGFVIGMRLHHALVDGYGLFQFVTAVAEMARGHASPTVVPVWSRELIQSRIPPRPSFPHPEYNEDEVETGFTINTSLNDKVHRAFFLSRRHIATLYNNVSAHLHKKASTFDILTACVWKCRTAALSPDPDEETHLIFAVTIRAPKKGLNIPKGYYGNAFTFTAAVSKAGNLCQNSLSYPLDLIMKAKAKVNRQYVQSVADLMVLRGRPHYRMSKSYIVSDITQANFKDIDFGWGKAVYGGLAEGAAGMNPNVGSVYMPFTNAMGEKEIAVPICLPAPAMEKFATELGKIIEEPTLPLKVMSTL